jgi:hypothetical protein
MNWDWNNAYAFVSFVVGGLAGFQAIYERYRDECGTAVNTPPGYGYLLSRGFIPALFFFLLYRTNQVHDYLFGLAIGLGLGTEAVLRSQIQIKSSKPTQGALATENTFIGFFNLLEWYQKFILESINTRMAAKRREIVQEAVRRVPPAMPFHRLCEVVKMNADALSDDKEIRAVEKEVQVQLAAFEKEVEQHGGQGTPEMQNRYQYKLGYWIYNKAGRRHGLRVLFTF